GQERQAGSRKTSFGWPEIFRSMLASTAKRCEQRRRWSVALLESGEKIFNARNPSNPFDQLRYTAVLRVNNQRRPQIFGLGRVIEPRHAGFFNRSNLRDCGKGFPSPSFLVLELFSSEESLVGKRRRSFERHIPTEVPDALLL